MADNPRIEELRRRVQLDPASIAFAALAEEYRRMGRHEEAIETCRAGLQRHPAYLSARVTLGRALIETGDYDGAREELETVLRSAPENLAAIRGLALIHERMGHSTEMDPHLAALMNAEVEKIALASAKPKPEPAPVPVHAPEPVPEPEPELASEPEPEPEPALAPEPVHELLAEPAADFSLHLDPEPATPDQEPFVEAPSPAFDLASIEDAPRDAGPDAETLETLARLERFLASIEIARHA